MIADTESTEYWVAKISDAVPELRQIVRGHVDFYGELIPHVLFGEIAAWADAAMASGQPSAELRVLLDLLDIGYAKGDADFRNVLEASFVENLGRRSPVLLCLGSNLGQFARAMFPDLPD